MKKEDVKIGMKVVPFQKTAFTHSLSASTIWKRALEINQHFLYVTNSSQDDFSLNYIKGNYGGDCFNAEDFVLYKEDTIKTDNKKQIKGEKISMNNKLEIRNVIYSNPATIVFWNDDTKTVVKTTEGEDYSPMYGVLMAYYQKHSGMSKTQTGKLMDKVIKDAEEQIKERSKVYMVEKEVKEFKVGDRVVGIENIGIHPTKDVKGTIVKILINEYEYDFVVRFDKPVEGWADRELKIDAGYGLYVKKDEIRLIK